MAAQELKKGDACPNCGEALQAVRFPSDAQLAKAADRESPVFINPAFDNASVAQRDELGALYRCRECGYKARFK